MTMGLTQKLQDCNISWVDIFVTERCNMKCEYCFHVQKPRDMEYDILEKSIDFLADKISPEVVFNFFGGEPLMRPDFCLDWMTKLKERFPKCRFHMSTNGTVVNKEIAELFKSKDYVFQISYDSLDQEKHRGHRDVVENNIQVYLGLIGPENINARLTYTKDTVKNLLPNMVHIYEAGIRKVMHHAVINNDWEEGDIEEYGNQIDKIYELLDDLKDFHLTFCDHTKVTQGKQRVICGAGKNVVAINAIGELFPCHRMINHPEMKIGNAVEGELDRGRFISLKLPECDSCEAKPTCHPCIAANYEATGSMLELLPATCGINKYEYKKAKDKYIELLGPLPGEDDLLENMTRVLLDIKQINNEIMEEIRNEKPIN